MKRLLILCLLALCLAGCGTSAPPETTAVTEPAATQSPPSPAPVGLYDPEESQALDPNGSIRCHPLQDLPVAAVRVMGEDLALFSSRDTTTLIRLSGENQLLTATVELPTLLDADAPGTQVGPKGITYYDGEARTLVFLNTALEEVNRLPLPEAILGDPILSPDRNALYYVTRDALRCIDLESKLDRLLLQMDYDRLQPVALHLNGTVLECFVQDGADQFSLYLRTENGEILATIGSGLSLYSSDTLYFARKEDPALPELLTGSPDKEPWILEPLDYDPITIPVMALNSLLTVASQQVGTRLELYDLRLGDRTASLTLPLRGECRSVVGDPATGCVWMIFSDGTRNLLLQWDPARSPVEDDTVYRLPRRSAENPDTEGLAACGETARQLGEAYDVDIHIWQDAVSCQPDDYALEAEYRVPLIRRSLEELDALLAMLPEGFQKRLVPGKDRLQICLTGKITGIGDDTALDRVCGIQFRDGENVPYVALSLSSPLAQTFWHELFHVIDSRVLSSCSAYDSWNSLNPKGFDYDYDYTKNTQRADTHWVEGAERAFTDLYAMSFPKEDRARIMEYAMTPGCEAVFASETMQRKLSTLCLGIRKAFRLEKMADELPWEQYLTEKLS